MAEEEVDSKKQVLRFAQDDKAFLSPKRSSRKIGGSGGELSDPKNGSTGKALSVEEIAKAELVNHFRTVVKCILINIRKNHLPSAKLLVDLAACVMSCKEVRPEEYQSLAEVLAKACEAQDVVLEG